MYGLNSRWNGFLDLFDKLLRKLMWLEPLEQVLAPLRRLLQIDGI